MAKKYLDYDGLLYFWQKIKANFVTDVTYNSTSKKIQKTKAGSTSDVVTLSTVATSGSYNDLSNKPSIPSIPNNFGTVKVGSTNVAADTTSDTLELVAGTDITLTPDATNDKVTIAFGGTIPSAGTGSSYPKMDGTRSLGSNAGYARVDHVHPSDTSRVPTTRTVNGKALSANITLGATDIDVSQNTADAIQTATGIQVSTVDDAIAEIVDNLNPSAEVNQNAFSNVKVGSTTIAADSKTDTLELVAGSNVTLTPDATNDKVTIAATDTKYTAASASPLMDGTAAVGSSAKYAREDHVHPIDTSRVPTTRKINGKALSGDITLDADDVSAIPTSAKGAASGVCPLNAASKIDATYLPSYVDDVIEAYARSGQTALSQNWLATGSASGTVITPEAGKIYVLMADSGDYAANTQFRWGGTAYVKLSDGGVSSITNTEIDTIVDDNQSDPGSM